MIREPIMKKKKKLLLVDDLREFLMMVKHILSQDYEVITAEDGQQAMELLEQGLEPDLIVTDLMMPHMDGYQLIAKIQAMDNGRNRIPVVVLSNVDRASERKRLLDQGACGYILKPFHPDELKENLRESLKNTLIPCS